MENNNLVFKNLVEQLPDELVNKIYMMLPQHPLVAMIEEDLEHMTIFGYCDGWDDFVKRKLRKYKNKCRNQQNYDYTIIILIVFRIF